MTGAESLLRTLLANGIDTCFMNPGTSEMHFVAALDRVPGMRGVLCLFEGVCSGAADGYARALGRPASTLLHLGPGLGNGLANFHNARKARSPIVNVVGEHATPHLQVDAPLTSDIETFARTVSRFVRTAVSAADVGQAATETIAAAWGPPGEVATLIVPADYSWTEGGVQGALFTPPVRKLPDLRGFGDLLRQPGTAILLGGTAVNARSLDACSRIAAATGTRILTARNVGKMAAGRGRFPSPQVPYFPEGALPFLADVKTLLLVEAEKPVSFFAYPGIPSYMTPEGCDVRLLATRSEDGTAALEALADGLPAASLPGVERTVTPLDDVALTLDHIGLAVAALLPEDALIADEMVSSAQRIGNHLRGAANYEIMPVTGGSIGQGLPVALGAALACPGRKTVALEADGSAMYTPQALWTMVREKLDVTAVILANRRYRILDIEMQRTGAQGFGEMANNMLDITRPELDFVKLAASMGVEGTRAATAREFTEQFSDAMAQRGPRLIEAVI